MLARVSINQGLVASYKSIAYSGLHKRMQQRRGGGGVPRLAMAVAVLVLAASSAGRCRAQLASGYYAGKCVNGGGGNSSVAVDVESIIHDAVQARLAWDKRMVAGLLHLIFHDCFVAVRTIHIHTALLIKISSIS